MNDFTLLFLHIDTGDDVDDHHTILIAMNNNDVNSALEAYSEIRGHDYSEFRCSERIVYNEDLLAVVLATPDNIIGL